MALQLRKQLGSSAIVPVLLCHEIRRTSQLLNEINDLLPCHSIIFQVTKSNELLDVDSVHLSGEHFLIFLIPLEIIQIKSLQFPHLLCSLDCQEFAWELEFP